LRKKIDAADERISRMNREFQGGRSSPSEGGINASEASYNMVPLDEQEEATGSEE